MPDGSIRVLGDAPDGVKGEILELIARGAVDGASL
jgi:hypothetical protein